MRFTAIAVTTLLLLAGCISPSGSTVDDPPAGLTTTHPPTETTPTTPAPASSRSSTMEDPIDRIEAAVLAALAGQ